MLKKKAILISNDTDLSETLIRGLHKEKYIIFSNKNIYLKYKNYFKNDKICLNFIVAKFKYRRLLNANAIIKFLNCVDSLITFVDHCSFATISIVALSKRIKIHIDFVDLYKANLFHNKKFNKGLLESLKIIFEDKYLRNSYIPYQHQENYGSNQFINMPVIKRSFIDRYISLEEFRKNFDYDNEFIKKRPCPPTKNFIWLDTAIPKNILKKRYDLENIFIKYANLFTIKKHPNEEISEIAKKMLENGAELIKLDLPMELFSLRKEVILICPLFSTFFKTPKKLLPNKLVSLLQLFIAEENLNKYYFGKYENIEFIDNNDVLINFLEG